MRKGSQTESDREWSTNVPLSLHVLVAKACEVGHEIFSVQEDSDVVSVDLPDRVVETIIIFDKTNVFGFCWFVKRVVTGYQNVIFVVDNELLPKPGNSVLSL